MLIIEVDEDVVVNREKGEHVYQNEGLRRLALGVNVYPSPSKPNRLTVSISWRVTTMINTQRSAS